VTIEAICDLDQAKAQQAASRWGVSAVYTDPALMIEEVKPDFVDIITRPETHFQLIEMAVESGVRAVICQKPLAPTFGEAQAIVDFTNKSGIRFMVHENWRFQPWYRQMKKMIESGGVGDRLHTIWSRMRTGDGWQKDAYLDRQPYFRTMPRLLIYETGIHFIDTYRYLAGEVDSVYAQLKKLNQEIEGEDAGIVLFNFSSGALGIFDGNRYNESTWSDNRYTFADVIIEASKGTLRLDGEGNITLQKLGKKVQPVDYDHENHGFAGDSVYFTQKHFIGCLLNSLPFETNGQEYLRSLEVQEAVYESAKKNTVVQLASGKKDS
jgi:D-apiose dehydrogenase